VLSRLGEFDQLDDVGMVELTHDLYLLEDVRSLEGGGYVSEYVFEGGGNSNKWLDKKHKVSRFMRTSTVFGVFLKSG
jgi:hypothetical protein